MNRKVIPAVIALFAGLTLAIGSGGYTAQEGFPKAGAATVNDIIHGWPEVPQKVAREMIQKYGQPNSATPWELTWYNNGPWKRTTLSREEVPHNFPMPHTDVLEQAVAYRVPPEKFDDLAEYDGSVIVERTKGEISARCDKEMANFLALNLADDIVNGTRSVQDARAFYAKTMKEAMEGKKNAYLQRLHFQPRQRAGDPDRAFQAVAKPQK